MKFVSWNVNGLRACVKKGFLDYFNEVDADVFCVQETKLQEGQIDPSFVITHTANLADGPDLYKTFRDKQDSCIKVVLKP